MYYYLLNTRSFLSRTLLILRLYACVFYEMLHCVSFQWGEPIMLKCILSFALISCGIVPAYALECVSFNVPGNYQNYQEIPTKNGTMVVAWFVENTRLPVVKRRLADNTTATGAVPGKSPMSFAWLDKSRTLRRIKFVSITYVTQNPSAPNDERFLELWDDREFSKIKITVKGRPFLVLNTLKYSVPISQPNIVKVDLNLNRGLLSRFCVDPGDRSGVSIRRLKKRLHRK